MFIVIDNPTFTHTVEAMVPTDGGYEKQAFKVTYNVVAGADYEKFDLATREGSDEFLREVIASLDDIAGADGKSLPYSHTLRDKVINLPWARRAIVSGYFKAVQKEAEGN
jgi:hypothetical protein